ncbi:BamA/TamA family outer membrane protein [Pontibacter sp. G13]|uniref:BamA/TamA family outer membrane protein n=1 Tax=Pontibacter sp. G13 TaxID=3074898 RepID=UPI00288A1868|nr:BamA/TamA family outer membrane protein [Pontibacter sp. G13]WNJ16493.1 BamA/TamA family outer membrane protein [Pontibacter sp. G13]
MIQEILLLGNQKTKDWVVLDEMTFQKGDTIRSEFLEDYVARSKQNVFNLQLFNEVEIQVQRQRNLAFILVHLKERWYVWGSPTIGLEERNSFDFLGALGSSDFHRFVYGGYVQWMNIWGNNERLLVRGQLGFSKKLEFDFLRPTFIRTPRLDLRFGGSYRSEQELILGTESGEVQWRGLETEPLRRTLRGYVGIRHRISLYQYLEAEIGYSSYRYSDSLYSFNLNGERVNYSSRPTGNDRYPHIQFRYFVDKRDYKSYPLNGFKLQVFGKFIGPESLGTTQFGKVGVVWAHHLPLTRRWNLAYGLHHIQVLGDTLPFFEKSFIGARGREGGEVSHTLRGYEPYVLDGTSVSMAKFELKFAVMPIRTIHLGFVPFRRFQDMPLGVFISTYTDFGYIRDWSSSNQDQTFKDQLLTGYGVGLNVIGFYDMLLRIEFSRNHLGQSGVYLHTTVQIK